MGYSYSFLILLSRAILKDYFQELFLLAIAHTILKGSPQDFLKGYSERPFSSALLKNYSQRLFSRTIVKACSLGLFSSFFFKDFSQRSFPWTILKDCPEGLS